MTINDEEASGRAVTVSTESVSTADENVSTAVFRVSLPSGITADEAITVTWAASCTSSGTAPDFQSSTTCQGTSATIAARQNFSTFSIGIVDDDLIEGMNSLL